MSAVAIVLILPLMAIIGALVFLFNKLYPGGIIKAFTSGEDTQFAVTSSVQDENPATVRLKETMPGTFQLVPGQSNTDPLSPQQPAEVTTEEAAQAAENIINGSPTGSPTGSPAGSSPEGSPAGSSPEGSPTGTGEERRIPADQSKLQHTTPIP